MEKLKVIIVPVGGKPQVKVVRNTLEVLRELVGGYIETVSTPYDENVVILCNEEGMLLDLPQNILSFYGDFVFVAVEPPEFTSLNEEQIKTILNSLQHAYEYKNPAE